MTTANKRDRAYQEAILNDSALGLLIEKSIAGDSQSYDIFLKNVGEMLRRTFQRSKSCGSRFEKIDELVQEVLMTIHFKRDQYKVDLPVVPWIRAIAKYRLIDSLRAEARQLQTVELSESPDPKTTSSESAIDLESVMLCLNERQREILLLSKVDELSHVEISKNST